MTEVMRCIVNDEDYSESIKLELIEAMSQGIGFSDNEDKMAIKKTTEK